MSDTEALEKIISLIINNCYADELDVLKWLFRKLEEAENNV